MTKKSNYACYLLVAIAMYLTSCTKPEPAIEGSGLLESDKVKFTDSQSEIQKIEIAGEWNLVYKDGNRGLPVNYKKGEVVWKFENQKFTWNNFIDDYSTVYDFEIADTLSGKQIKLDGMFWSNIILLTNDSLKIEEDRRSCGAGYILIR